MVIQKKHGLNFGLRNDGFSFLFHLGEHLEASSGCYSAIALKGISAQGIELEREASQSFQRNIPLSFHPLAQVFNTISVDWELLDEDWLSLKKLRLFSPLFSFRFAGNSSIFNEFREKDCPLMRDYFITNRYL